MNAFERLQLEIMKNSDDESLFAWEDKSLEYSGLLEQSPAAFRYSSDVLRQNVIERPPYSMSNKGLQIDATLVPSPGRLLAILDCAREDDSGALLAVVLRRCMGINNFQRFSCGMLVSYPISEEFRARHRPWPCLETSSVRESVFLKQAWAASDQRSTLHFKVEYSDLLRHGFRHRACHLANAELGRWGRGQTEAVSFRLSNTTAVIQFNSDKESFVLRTSTSGGYATLELILFCDTSVRVHGLATWQFVQSAVESFNRTRRGRSTARLSKTERTPCNISATLASGANIQAVVQARTPSGPQQLVVVLEVVS